MLETSFVVKIEDVIVEGCGVRLGSVEGSVGKGSDSFVGGAHSNLVNGARCSDDGLVVGVIEGIFEFVEGVLRKVGLLCENEMMVE